MSFEEDSRSGHINNYMNIRAFLAYLLIVGATLFAPPRVLAQSCSPNLSGDYTITTDCSFPGTTSGVDAGSGTTNTATLTVSLGILTILPEQRIAFGQLVVGDNAVIALPTDNSAMLLPGAAIWMIDANDDHVSDSSAQQASTSAPGVTWRRRNTIIEIGGG